MRERQVLELALFQPVDIRVAYVEYIGQEEHDGRAWRFPLGVLGRRRGRCANQAQQGHAFLGVLPLEYSNRAVGGRDVAGDRVRLVRVAEKQRAQLIGGGDDPVGLGLWVDRRAPDDIDLDQLLAGVAEDIGDAGLAGAFKEIADRNRQHRGTLARVFLGLDLFWGDVEVLANRRLD